MKKSTITSTTIATTAIALTIGIALTGCIGSAISTLEGPPKPKVYVSDALIEKDADHTWEVTDQASFAAAANGINNAGDGKKHIVNVKNSFSTPNSPHTAAFYLTATNIAVVLEGNATIFFSPAGRTTNLLEVSNGQAIIVRDIKLQGHSNSTESLVKVRAGGKFIMEGSASVSGNTARGSSKKRAAGACSNKTYPGGVYVTGGAFIMKDNSSVSGNTSSGEDCHGRGFGSGGGVELGVEVVSVGTFSSVSGTFTMQDNASVTGNSALEYGGGVYVSAGTFVMKDNSAVSGNTAGTGGGVYGRVTIQDNAKVSGNTARTGVGSDVQGKP
jgi:predicted outer membrane repeat protein